MGRVISLGSINVDRLHHVDQSTVSTLADRYDWFPDAGETVAVDDIPDELDGSHDAIEHGGKGANQAVAAARAGADAAMLGLVGTDHDEYEALSALQDAGVATDHVGVADAPTGTADIFLTPDGENRIAIRAGANGELGDEYVDRIRGVVRAADCLLLQNEIPADPVVDLLETLDDDGDRPTVILDPAPPEGTAPLLASRAVDVLTPNEHEYRTIRPNLDAFEGILLRKRGADDVIVEARPEARSPGPDTTFRVGPPSVDVVDTTGAGDVLNGYLAAELARGTDLERAVAVATVAAAMATRESGARNGVPSREAVLAFVDER